MVRAYRWLPLLILPVAWKVLYPAYSERGDAWPTLGELVPRCHLIVHCRLGALGDQQVWRVLDIWRGGSSPLEFPHATSDKAADPNPQTGGEITGGEVTDGSTLVSSAAQSIVPTGSAVDNESILFFFKTDDAAPGGLARADLTLPVRNGRVVYPPGGEEPDLREYPLADLKREIALLATRGATAGTSSPRLPMQQTPQTLAGRWRVFLPAGFEREVELEPLGGGRYRFKPGHLTFGGVYQLADGRLELIEPSEPRLAGFAWQLRTPYLLTLVAEAPGTSARYLGGVLFRPSDAGL